MIGQEYVFILLKFGKQNVNVKSFYTQTISPKSMNKQ